MSLLLEFIRRGGWVMYPLIAASLVALAMTLERLWAVRREKVLPRAFILSLSELLDRRQYEQAALIASGEDNAASRLAALALKIGGRRRSQFREVLEDAGRREAQALTAHLNVLSLVASISPLLGLLGTVSGMINAFNSIAAEGVGNPGLVAGGISEALLTTAAGLCLAIPTLVAHRFLLSRAETIINEMEDLSSDLMEALASAES